MQWSVGLWLANSMNQALCGCCLPVHTHLEQEQLTLWVGSTKSQAAGL